MKENNNPYTMAYATGGNPTPTPMLRFGSDVGIATVNPTPGLIADRMSRLANDNLPIVRYFYVEGADSINDFLSHAYSNGRKVSVVFEAKTYYTTSRTAAQYASDVESALTTAQAYITGNYAGTIIAVELGNEEDACNDTRPLFNNNATDARPSNFWAAGVNFSAYYIAAYDAVIIIGRI